MLQTIFITNSKKELLEADPGFARAEREGDTFNLMTIDEAEPLLTSECETCAYRLRMAKRLGMNMWVIHLNDLGEYHISGLCPLLGDEKG